MLSNQSHRVDPALIQRNYIYKGEKMNKIEHNLTDEGYSSKYVVTEYMKILSEDFIMI